MRRTEGDEGSFYGSVKRQIPGSMESAGAILKSQIHKTHTKQTNSSSVVRSSAIMLLENDTDMLSDQTHAVIDQIWMA